MGNNKRRHIRLPLDYKSINDALTIPQYVVSDKEDITYKTVPTESEHSRASAFSDEICLETVMAEHPHFSFLTLGTRIGTGGLAAVYRMITTEKGHGDPASFALKVPLHLTPEMDGHFAREAHILRELRKKGAAVPEVVSHGNAADIPYILMDDLGLDFLQCPLIHHKATVAAVERTTRVGYEVSAALLYLHQLGYRHNDVKPRNIHYALSGRIHLIDFASASSLGEQTNAQAFTPRYLAPERITDEFPVGEGVDVFGLGTTLYELLSGHHAFGVQSHPTSIGGIQEHIHLVKTRGYAPLEGYSLQLTSLIYAMLEYNPAQRPSLQGVQRALSIIREDYFG